MDANSQNDSPCGGLSIRLFVIIHLVLSIWMEPFWYLTMCGFIYLYFFFVCSSTLFHIFNENLVSYYLKRKTSYSSKVACFEQLKHVMFPGMKWSIKIPQLLSSTHIVNLTCNLGSLFEMTNTLFFVLTSY